MLLDVVEGGVVPSQPLDGDGDARGAPPFDGLGPLIVKSECQA